MPVSGQRQTPTAWQPGKSPDTNFTRGWVSSGRSWHVHKASSSPGLEPRTLQPTVSYYINYSTLISSKFLKKSLFYLISINSLMTWVIKRSCSFRHVRKMAKNDYYLHVCPSILRLHETTLLPLDRFTWNMIVEYFSRICRGNLTLIKIWPE
jgi:hypothetical protein